MGPIIILDKSAIQSFSAQEMDFLYRYYLINVAPVLLIEILGDLMKPDKQGALTGDDVVQLSSKLIQMESAINVNYRVLLTYSLLGNQVIMDGRPVIPGGKWVHSPDGKKGVMFDESEEEKTIHRWRAREFTAAEALLSKSWREATRLLDLNKLKEMYKPIAEKMPATPTMPSLLEQLDKILLNPDLQSKVLELMCYEFPINYKLVSEIFHRWEQREHSLVINFAPYAFYCFRVTLAFYLGLARDFVGTRPTNQIDLEYIYYLPFAMAFCSGDKFHASFVPHFLREDQAYVPASELKQDLAWYVSTLNSMAEDKRKAWLLDNGHYPPVRDGSPTTELWNKNMRTRSPRPSKSETSNRPSQTANDIMARIRELEDLDSSGSRVTQPDLSEMDFLVRKHRVSVDDPCPCGSGKKLKDCHLPQVKRGEQCE